MQERFKYMNPWLMNLVKTTGTYHSYVSKVYEQLAERSEMLNQAEDFNSYKNKLFDFSKIESFVQIIQSFDPSNSNGSQIKTSQAPVPQPKPEPKPTTASKNPFVSKSYQNFDRMVDPFSEPVADNKPFQPEKVDMKSSMINDKSSKTFLEMPPINQPTSNQKRASQEDGFLSYEVKTDKKPPQQIPNVQQNLPAFVSPNQQSQSSIPNFQPSNTIKPPTNPNLNGIATQNRNVNMFGMPKSNPNAKKPPLNPLNFKNIDGNPPNHSDITQSQQFTNPFGLADKNSMYFGQPNQGHSAQGYKDPRQPENTWTPNPKSQSFSQIKEFAPRSSSKDEILQLNFDPSK